MRPKAGEGPRAKRLPATGTSTCPPSRIVDGQQARQLLGDGRYRAPAAPASEIHVDSRPLPTERGDGARPRPCQQGRSHRSSRYGIIVFMQFNRKRRRFARAAGYERCIDTGMGFERLVPHDAGQALPTTIPTSSMPYHQGGRAASPAKNYGESELQTDVAMRVVADHLRAVAFCYRRRSAAVQCQGWLRHPPHPAPCHPLCLYLPRTERGIHLPSAARARSRRWATPSPSCPHSASSSPA